MWLLLSSLSMHKEKSLCPTFVCDCPLIFIENLLFNPLTFHYVKVFWSIAVSVSQRILCMRHSHLSKMLWTSSTLNLLVPLQPHFCRHDKNCNACGEALLTSRTCTGSTSVMLWESILQIQICLHLHSLSILSCCQLMGRITELL